MVNLGTSVSSLRLAPSVACLQESHAAKGAHAVCARQPKMDNIDAKVPAGSLNRPKLGTRGEEAHSNLANLPYCATQNQAWTNHDHSV